ncbi:MAG: TssN family type VI secretion system protein [Ferruginibacter sp.]
MEPRFAEYEQQDILMDGSASSMIHPVKRIILYLLILTAVSTALALTFTMNLDWEISGQAKKTMYVSVLFIFGIGHIFYFPKWLRDVHEQDKKIRFQFSLLMAILAGVAAFLVFGFADFEKPQLAIAGACSFLLPTVILYAWNHFDAIAPRSDLAWYLPAAMPKKMSIYLNSLQVKIKVKQHYFDIAETTFQVTIPGHLPLGHIFHQFVRDRAEENVLIELTDQQHQPFAWKFFLQKPFGKRVIDPEVTVIENNIKEKDTVLAERISVTEPAGLK